MASERKMKTKDKREDRKIVQESSMPWNKAGYKAQLQKDLKDIRQKLSQVLGQDLTKSDNSFVEATSPVKCIEGGVLVDPCMQRSGKRGSGCDAPKSADRFPRSADGSFKSSEGFPTPVTSPLRPPKQPRTEVRQYSWRNFTRKEVCMHIRTLKPFKSVTSPLHESRLLWIHDPHPNQPPHVTPRQAVPKKNNDTVPRNNYHTVPRNTNTVNKSDTHARAPLGTIPSASWYNSNLPLPRAPSPRKNVCKPVPRNNVVQKGETVQVHKEASSSSLPPKKKRDRKHRRERENNSESFIHDARWANQRSLVPASSSVPVRVTQSVPQAVDLISSMRTAVYPPLESVGNPIANENSPFQIGRESSRNLALYKPTAPDPDQDTWAYNFAANSLEVGPPSPTRTFCSEQLGLRKQDKDYLPPSATRKTS